MEELPWFETFDQYQIRFDHSNLDYFLFVLNLTTLTKLVKDYQIYMLHSQTLVPRNLYMFYYSLPGIEMQFRQLSKIKSRIRETPTISTNADSRTDTNLKRLRDLCQKKILHTGDKEPLDQCG